MGGEGVGKEWRGEGGGEKEGEKEGESVRVGEGREEIP